jgi:ATP-dependent DNA helicase RecG
LLHGPSSVAEIVQVLGQKSLSGGTKLALHQLLQRGLISLTIPDKPNSKNQKRQLTDKGRQWLKENGDVR